MCLLWVKIFPLKPSIMKANPPKRKDLPPMQDLNFSYHRYMHYNEQKLPITYPNGAILVLTIDDNEIYILGEGDYVKDIDINNRQTRTEIMEQFLEVAPPHIKIQEDCFFLEMASPIARSNISLKHALPFSIEDFYWDKAKVINNYFHACSRQYPKECNPSTFSIALYKPATFSTGIFYLGYTIEKEYDLSALRYTLGEHVFLLTYEKFHEKRQGIVSDLLSSQHNPYGKEMAEMTKQKDGFKHIIANWLTNTPYADFHSHISSRVLGQPNLSLILVNIYNYFENLAKGTPCHSNILLSAPSGCGKTETYRALHDYFAEYLPFLPVLQIDVTHFTEAGYRGRNIDEIFQIIAARKTLGIGIIFFDEFDKKLIPSLNSAGIDYNAALQAELLTLLEGSPILDKNGKLLFDSSNTLFICLGSFNYIREKKLKRLNAKSIGFENQIKKPTNDHFIDITIGDVIEQGGSYELAGRFSLLINYYKLRPEIIDIIIDKTLEQLSKMLSIDIIITPVMREYLHQNANSEYGCRRLRTLIEEAAYPVYNQILLNEKYRSDFEIILDDKQKAHYQRKIDE